MSLDAACHPGVCIAFHIYKIKHTPISDVRRLFSAPSALMKNRGACRRAHLIKQLAVLHLFSNALQGAERLVKEHGQADSRQILANALLDDGPQAHTLLALLWRWQPLAPWGRRQLLFKPPGDVLFAAGPHSRPAKAGRTTLKSLQLQYHFRCARISGLTPRSRGGSSFFSNSIFPAAEPSAVSCRSSKLQRL